MNFFKKEISYSKQKIKDNILKQWIFYVVYFSVSIFLLLYCFKYLRLTLDHDSLLIAVSMILGIILGLIIVWVNKYTNDFFLKTDIGKNIARKGDEGEKVAYLKLTKILDQKYKIHKNFKLPGAKFDFDFLIIGPKGVVVLEIKNSDNSYVFTEKEAIRVKISKYSREETKLFGPCDHREKLIKRCNFLGHHLNSLGLGQIKVKKALVFVDSKVEIKGKSKVFIVSNINELAKYFDNLNEDRRFSQDFCEKIDKKLGFYN
ncbi:NERD domain-containing protein [bacterium]|nr:NERD domain-containing protein [bacterium]